MAKSLSIGFVLFAYVAVAPAQFSTNSKNITGNVSWNKTYYDGQDMGTVLIIAPSLGYFVKNDVAVITSVSLTAFQYNGFWQVDDGNLGLGVKYFYEVDRGAVYGSASFNFNGFKSPRSLSADLGFLLGLSKEVFLDFGLDYSMGIGDDKLSTLNLGVGIASFF
jgi:hypothetical protein